MSNVDNNTPYDDVFRTLVNDLPRATLKLINEMFDGILPVKYSGNEKVEQLVNEQLHTQQDGIQEKRVTDARIRVIGADVRQFHVECQSTPDGSIIIRMFEYDSKIALQDSQKASQELTVNYPHSGILFLRTGEKTPDRFRITINTPGGSIRYEVPTLKVKDYSADDVIERELYFLIPFYLFKFGKLMESGADLDDGNMEKLREDFLKLRKYLDDSCKSGKIDEFEALTIRDMSKKVLRNLAGNAADVRKEVEDIMGGKVLDYEAKNILNKGRAEGRAEGRNLAFYELVEDGALSVEKAAGKLGVSEEQFVNGMLLTGHKVPE